MAAINRTLAAEGKRGMVFSSEINLKEETWNYWYDPVDAIYKVSAPLHVSKNIFSIVNTLG